MRQSKILLPTSVSLFRQVFAGCCEPLLEGGPSRRYLCDPCIGAWVRTPPRLSGALVCFFPAQHRPLLKCKRIGSLETFPTKQLYVGRCSRGCNHSLTFKLPYLLDPPTVLTIRALCPSGHRAVYTGQYSRRYRSRAPASLRVRTRQLTRQDL